MSTHEPKPSKAMAEAMASLFSRAVAAWPGVAVASEELIAAIVQHAPAELPLADWLATVHASDLYLALACIRKDPTALAAFETNVMSRLGEFLARMRQPPAFVDDVGQLLRQQLYVPFADRTAKLAEYSGKGTLVSWVRVLAVRTAIDVKRKRTEILRDANEILDEASQTGGSDPEIAFVRERCRAHFAAALETAVAALSDEERLLLRLHFLEGVTLDELAPLVGAHRTTVARRIAVARQQLIDEGRRILEERLALSPSELESMVRIMGSRMQLTLAGLL